MKKILIPLIISIFANAAEPVIGEKSELNPTAIILFLIFVLSTLFITYYHYIMC